MALALVITTMGFANLIFVQEANSPPLIYGAYYAGTLFGLYLVVRLLLPYADALLLAIVTLLTGVGLVLIYRLTSEVEGVENLALTALGMIASTFTPLGYEVNGARLWVAVGPVNIQPSEFARIALVVFFAGY